MEGRGRRLAPSLMVGIPSVKLAYRPRWITSCAGIRALCLRATARTGERRCAHLWSRAIGVHRIMSPRTSMCALFGVVLAAASIAAADTTFTVTPTTARPGDPVLVTVVGSPRAPRGTANGKALQFFPIETGYQAVFAIALDARPDPVAIRVDSIAEPQTVQVGEVAFPETDVVVEDELANPSKLERERIDADNAAIVRAVARARGEPQFVRAFRRPPGEVNSDGHRSQHLGLDLFAREGTRVKAINAGTVVLVRPCFLGGNVVVVAHGGGIASAYLHLSKFSVAEGDHVAQGDEIGRAGHTGRTTGPHLHLGIHVPGGMVDPVAFFQLKIPPAGATVTRR
ncbi:MAG: M23 family metallopeptidase [Deltaproteobacteria bacterium]|nr:MAG: M23 family metallopeptidase [Deltaproteobacteria bacterium]